MKKQSNVFARSLRKNQTDAERLLWKYLRSRRFQGLKFRRQQPMGPYVVDFCSFAAKLIVELDGGQHAERAAKDAARTKFLEQGGFRVVRFWDHEMLGVPQAVLEEMLEKVLGSPSPRPSPLKGEGGKKRRGS